MKKNSQIVEMSIEELTEEFSLQSEAIKKLKFNHAIAPLESPSQIKNTRRYIARLQTEITRRSKA